MAIQTLNTIKNWFKTGSKPSQDQFWDTWDSFQHKYEKVPIKDIEELETTLDTKAEKSQLDDHKNDQIAHAGLFSGKEDKYQKGVAGGYVPLDEFSKIAHQYLNLINNLTAGGENSILSAEQGVVLQNQIDNINRLLKCDNVDLDTVQKIVDAVTQIQTSIDTILVNDLTTGGITKALTAEMGKILELNKEDKSQKGIPNGYVPLDEFSKIAHQYLSIVNNLTTGGATASLSAEQGVVLQSQIDGILTVLSSDNINLDTIQEIVDAIETVQVSLSSILVNDFTTGGVTKALTAEMGKFLDQIKLTATLATDAETQITAAVPEDNKVVSRSKLFNWWNWIKTQTQTIGGVWNFSKGLKVTDSMSYTTEMKQDKFVSKLNLSPGVIFSTEYGFQGVKWISPDGGYVHLIADSTPAERYNYIYVPSKSGLLALAGDFITTPAGTKTEAPLIIPNGTLTTVPQNGAIERDDKGRLFETHDGIRNKVLTTAEGVILLAYKNNALVSLTTGGNKSFSYTRYFDLLKRGSFGNDNIYRVNALTNTIYLKEGYPPSGSIEPIDFKVELHMVPLNCVFQNNNGWVPSVKLAEYSGLNNNGIKDFQGFIITEASNFITVSSETIKDNIKSISSDSYVVRDSYTNALFPMSDAYLQFEMRFTVTFADANNDFGVNKNTHAEFKNYCLFVEIIK